MRAGKFGTNRALLHPISGHGNTFLSSTFKMSFAYIWAIVMKESSRGRTFIWNPNNTTAEFALIRMECPMKYLSGGTTHHETVIPKTMKVPPPSMFQLWGSMEKRFGFSAWDLRLWSSTVRSVKHKVCSSVTGERVFYKHGKEDTGVLFASVAAWKQ